MGEREKKPRPKTRLLVFLAALLALVVIWAVEANGRDLGVLGTVTTWVCGIVMLLAFLEPFSWLLRVARGGSPWDN